ncbi:MAG: leucine-rich repeat domain-containing protein [Clostridia bacterium]|nr:leucine-rich repeat domain-containing protein [Clostridia bacterium]
MKKKLLLITLIMMLFVCMLAISISATDMANYCDVQITLVDGTEITGYCEIGSNGRLQRDSIYKTPDKTSETISWSDVKIFNAGKTTVVGELDPTAIAGTGCHAQATNVTEFHFPPTITTILNDTFNGNWTSLETVYVPKSVEAINDRSFYQSAVKAVVIEEGSALKTIKREAFRECSNLDSINLPEGLETIEYCAFYITNLNGTFVVPNSVTSISDGAFRKTKIETLVLGDGPVSLGYNLVGDDSINTYLKKVYIPSEATFIGTVSQIWYATSGATLELYVIGNEGQDVSDFVATLKGTGRVKFATEAEIEAGTATSDYNAIIKLGYNKCQAFYNNLHKSTENDNDCTTPLLCETCNFVLEAANEAHDNGIIIEYANGYLDNGYKREGCTRCSVFVEEETEPLFECQGYSTQGYSNGGIQIGFVINYEAIEAYNSSKNTEIKYGIFAVAQGNAQDEEGNDKAIINADGTSITGVASVDFSKHTYDIFAIRVIGFETEAHMNAQLALGAYVIDGDKVSYLQAGTPTEGKTYCYTSYNEQVNN